MSRYYALDNLNCYENCFPSYTPKTMRECLQILEDERIEREIQEYVSDPSSPCEGNLECGESVSYEQPAQEDEMSSCSFDYELMIKDSNDQSESSQAWFLENDAMLDEIISLQNRVEVETCVSSPPLFVEEIIESEPSFSTFDFQPLINSSDCIEVVGPSFPLLPTIPEQLNLSQESVESLEDFDPILERECYFEMLHLMGFSLALAPPPLPIEESWGCDFDFSETNVVLSPVVSKSPIVRPKFQIGDGSLFSPPTCLPLFKRNSYFSGGMFALEGPPLIFQSQIPFWVDPQLFRLLVYS